MTADARENPSHEATESELSERRDAEQPRHDLPHCADAQGPGSPLSQLAASA
jgi:hypothetical protein